MARVTSKLQVTIPKTIADRYGIRPGADIEWLPAGEAIRVVLVADQRHATDPERRLELFDGATQRQRERDTARGTVPEAADRGWRREELYERGSAG
jgi:bifunctional DNA-binding transcriptional regulator/antitoxin component of YhaV-PrlF toxin-antitoxin module